MKKYIFLTTEGYIYQSISESIEPYCDNAQLIGKVEGNNQEEAFKNLAKGYPYLEESNFEKLYFYQLEDNYEETMESFIINKDN